jgi:hypothetical protein
VPLEATLIPLDQLIPELLLALGGAFLLGNLAAYVRLRPAWREARQSKHTPAGREGADAAEGGPEGGGRRPSSRPAARASGGQGAGTTRAGARPAGARTGSLPSRTRVLVNVLVGLVVTVASLAALIARG